MTDPLRPLPLTELRLLEQGRQWRVDQRIQGLESLTSVQGSIRAVHHGTALEVTADAETIVTLCCDRCLQHFNHPVHAEVHELVELRGLGDADPASWNDVSLKLASEGMPEGADLDDRLDPAGCFDPERWLFEQLSLRLPLVNRCGDDCPGPATWSSEPTGGDPRWAALVQLGLGTQSGAKDGADSETDSETVSGTVSRTVSRKVSSTVSGTGSSREPGTESRQESGHQTGSESGQESGDVPDQAPAPGGEASLRPIAQDGSPHAAAPSHRALET